MPHEHREADGQGGGAQASVAPLISHGEDADDELQGEEDLDGGGHAQTDARLQLVKQEEGGSGRISTGHSQRSSAYSGCLCVKDFVLQMLWK